MLYYLYDHTFEGFLTAVFDIYFRKENPERIVSQTSNIPLFTETHTIITDEEKASRVFHGLKKKISRSALNMLYICFLSEFPDIELMMLRYIRKALAAEISIETNFADEDVLELAKIYKKVNNESLHIKQFVRFRKTADGMFFAIIEPLYNVLPLCADFFQDRYADQPWLIYDTHRQFGLYYDLKNVETVHFEQTPDFLRNGKIKQEQQDESESAFQDLWKDYLSSITIRERKNLKLQRQFMPKRFWKYLIEKS